MRNNTTLFKNHSSDGNTQPRDELDKYYCYYVINSNGISWFVVNFHDVELADRKWNIHKVLKAIVMPQDLTGTICNDDIGVRMCSSKWVPHLLTTVYECNSVTTSKECLFDRNPDEFKHCFIIVDET